MTLLRRTAEVAGIFVLVGGIALLFTHATCGCAATDKLETAVRSGAQFADLAEPVLVEAYRAEQRACLNQAEPEPCVTAVRSRWKPLLDAYDAARSSWCLLDETLGSARCAP